MSSLLEKLIKDSSIRFVFYVISFTVTVTVSATIYYTSVKTEIAEMPDRIAAAVVKKVDSLQYKIDRTNKRLDTLTAYLRIESVKEDYGNKITNNRLEEFERRFNEFIRPDGPSIEKKRFR